MSEYNKAHNQYKLDMEEKMRMTLFEFKMKE